MANGLRGERRFSQILQTQPCHFPAPSLSCFQFLQPLGCPLVRAPHHLGARATSSHNPTSRSHRSSVPCLFLRKLNLSHMALRGLLTGPWTGTDGPCLQGAPRKGQGMAGVHRKVRLGYLSGLHLLKSCRAPGPQAQETSSQRCVCGVYIQCCLSSLSLPGL